MGKYKPIGEWLKNSQLECISLSFEEIEKILGSELPPSAYVHSRWWMNDTDHSQAKAWLGVGFTVSNVSQVLATQVVEFSKQCNVKMAHTAIPNYTSPPKIERTKIESDSPVISVAKERRTIILDGYRFVETPFEIYKRDIPSPFLQYHGRTVNELLCKSSYQSLRKNIQERYPQFLDVDIQAFMAYLMSAEDNFYLNFLNKNGNDAFCHFALTDRSVFPKKGLYIYVCGEEITYIGRCKDNFYNRFNVNYGKIQPINCYKHGQSTNTHMNSLMNKHGDKIRIYLCCVSSIEEIVVVEKALIRKTHPNWNRVL